MFSTYRITTAEGHEIRQQRSLAALVLTLFALSALLMLLTSCGSSPSAVTSLVAQAQSVRSVQAHLVPAPPFPRPYVPHKGISIPFQGPTLA